MCKIFSDSDGGVGAAVISADPSHILCSLLFCQFKLWWTFFFSWVPLSTPKAENQKYRTLPLCRKTPSKTVVIWGPALRVPPFRGFAGCLWFTLPRSAQATRVSEVTGCADSFSSRHLPSTYHLTPLQQHQTHLAKTHKHTLTTETTTSNVNTPECAAVIMAEFNLWTTTAAFSL